MERQRLTARSSAVTWARVQHLLWLCRNLATSIGTLGLNDVDRKNSQKWRAASVLPVWFPPIRQWVDGHPCDGVAADRTLAVRFRISIMGRFISGTRPLNIKFHRTASDFVAAINHRGIDERRTVHRGGSRTCVNMTEAVDARMQIQQTALQLPATTVAA